MYKLLLYTFILISVFGLNQHVLYKDQAYVYLYSITFVNYSSAIEYCKKSVNGEVALIKDRTLVQNIEKAIFEKAYKTAIGKQYECKLCSKKKKTVTFSFKAILFVFSTCFWCDIKMHKIINVTTSLQRLIYFGFCCVLL